MDVIVLSDAKAAKRCFERVAKLGDFAVIHLPVRDYKTVTRKLEGPTVLYLDVTTLADGERMKAVNHLLKSKDSFVGIIDPKGTMDDVAALMHKGAFDYVGQRLWREGIEAKRFRSALDFVQRPADGQAPAAAPKKSRYLVAERGWNGVVAGREYTFCFMFCELDLNEDWRKKSGKEHLDRVTAAFESHLQRTVTPMGGRLWIWESYGGLIIFPFDGKKCDAILTAYRMILNRAIISAEEYQFDTLLSYRIALHLGNTVFRPRGSTGTIISDTVNFIFHLGHQFAQAGNFYLTEEIRPFIPKGLEDFFVEAGTFEGMKCWRMKRPVA